jgi:hypothetical protein
MKEKGCYESSAVGLLGVNKMGTNNELSLRTLVRMLQSASCISGVWTTFAMIRFRV